MGRIKFNRLWLTAVMVLVCVASSGAVIRHTAVFDTSGVVVTPTVSGADSVGALAWPEMLPDGAVPGAPQLAGRQLKFIVPAYVANFRVSVKGTANGRRFTLPHILAPAQRSVPTGVADSIGPTPPDMSLYGPLRHQRDAFRRSF